MPSIRFVLVVTVTSTFCSAPSPLVSRDTQRLPGAIGVRVVDPLDGLRRVEASSVVALAVVGFVADDLEALVELHVDLRPVGERDLDLVAEGSQAE